MSAISDILYTKEQTPLEFQFDNLMGPPVYSFLTREDVYQLNKIATSLKYASNVKLKYKMMDSIMAQRGFRHLELIEEFIDIICMKLSYLK